MLSYENILKIKEKIGENQLIEAVELALSFSKDDQVIFNKFIMLKRELVVLNNQINSDILKDSKKDKKENKMTLRMLKLLDSSQIKIKF